jgi:hypothetical protein
MWDFSTLHALLIEIQVLAHREVRLIYG